MRYLVFICMLFALSGCSNSSDVDKWVVTDAKFPGISAIGLDEAREWYGSEAIYSESQVSFRGEACEQPQFTTREVTEAEFNNLYRTSFSALEINAPTVTVIEVGCPETWTTAGATFIKVDSETGYIPWDGVFFKLIRNFNS